VEFVLVYRSSTLVATSDAPTFVKAAIGQIVHRKLGDDAVSNL
jgi:hypothetical protein